MDLAIKDCARQTARHGLAAIDFTLIGACCPLTLKNSGSSYPYQDRLTL